MGLVFVCWTNIYRTKMIFYCSFCHGYNGKDMIFNKKIYLETSTKTGKADDDGFGCMPVVPIWSDFRAQLETWFQKKNKICLLKKFQ